MGQIKSCNDEENKAIEHKIQMQNPKPQEILLTYPLTIAEHSQNCSSDLSLLISFPNGNEDHLHIEICHFL